MVSLINLKMTQKLVVSAQWRKLSKAAIRSGSNRKVGMGMSDKS